MLFYYKPNTTHLVPLVQQLIYLTKSECTWRRTVEREQGELGFKGWVEAGSCGKDREAWRERTQGPISLRAKRT